MVPTTVTVTAISLLENASATAEVVVKDQLGATMTTGFTLTYASSNTSIFSVATTGVVTAAAYNSGTPTGTLTVTATPTVAGGTAVTGTATVTVSADTVVPTLDSVTVVDAKTIILNFNKELKQNGAETVKNYSLYIASSGKLLPLNTAKTNATPATDIGAYATLLADKKKVQITITDATTTAAAVDGMVLDGFADGATYSIYVDQSEATKVGDLAATQNVVVTNSNKSFVAVSTPSVTFLL